MAEHKGQRSGKKIIKREKQTSEKGKSGVAFYGLLEYYSMTDCLHCLERLLNVTQIIK